MGGQDSEESQQEEVTAGGGKRVEKIYFIAFVRSKGITDKPRMVVKPYMNDSLVLVAREGVGDGLSSVANSVGGLLGDALALVAAGAGSVTDLLACALLALCGGLASVQGRVDCVEGHTRLDGSGNAVTGTGQVLAGLLGGRLLGVGGDCGCVSGCMWQRGKGGREGRTLLGGLLAESLAKSVRHDDGWLVGWLVVVVVVVE